MAFLHAIGGRAFVAEAIAVPTQGGSVTVGCFSRHPESEIKTSAELFAIDYAHKLPAQRLQTKALYGLQLPSLVPFGKSARRSADSGFFMLIAQSLFLQIVDVPFRNRRNQSAPHVITALRQSGLLAPLSLSC
jgi:hypothetical protein